MNEIYVCTLIKWIYMEVWLGLSLKLFTSQLSRFTFCRWLRLPLYWEGGAERRADCGLSSLVSLGDYSPHQVGHNWNDFAHTHRWVRRIPWRKKWQHTPVFLPGNFHGQRSLVHDSPWDCCKELDMAEWLNTWEDSSQPWGHEDWPYHAFQSCSGSYQQKPRNSSQTHSHFLTPEPCSLFWNKGSTGKNMFSTCSVRVLFTFII